MTKVDLELKLCKEISREIGASLEEVVSIVRTQAKYVSHVMEFSGFESVSLPYLGKFLVKPARLRKLNELMADKRLINSGVKWESSKKKTTR